MIQLLSAILLILLSVFPFFAEAAPYQVVDVAGGGNIIGKVTYSGDEYPPRLYPIAKDGDTCGTGFREVEFVKVQKNGTLTNVVVYLEKVKAGKPFPAVIEEPKIDQKNCRFSPHLQVMRNGDTVQINNSDPVTHNVHTYEIIGSAKRTVFNINQPPELKVLNKQVKLRRGNAMKVECDAHDFMHGFVFVAKNPYYALVDENGHFNIDNVPPGTYTVNAWHGILGEKEDEVTIASGDSVSIDFDFDLEF